MKKVIITVSFLLISLSLLITGCAGALPTGGAKGDLSGKKIALLMQMNLGTFSAQYIAGVKEQTEKLGGRVTVFASDGDLAKMTANLDAAVNQHFDGILIDHGTPEALQNGIQKAVERKIPVVVFDANVNIPGVTVLSQGDQEMAKSVLEKLAVDNQNKGNIVKIWVAGFAPMERRQVAYKEFLKSHPEIKEVASFGSATQNTALDTQAQMEALLKKYPNRGEITAVWAAWDEFAKGASRAIEQAGRTEIKVYGIDMSDEDLQMLQKTTSPWVATSAVDPKDIGRVQVRYLFQKLHQDKTPDQVVLKPSLITREKLPQEKITTDQLSKYIKEWGNSTEGVAPWMH